MALKAIVKSKGRRGLGFEQGWGRGGGAVGAALDVYYCMGCNEDKRGRSRAGWVKSSQGGVLRHGGVVCFVGPARAV